MAKSEGNKNADEEYICEILNATARGLSRTELTKIATKSKARDRFFGDVSVFGEHGIIAKLAELSKIEEMVFVMGTDEVCKASDVTFVPPTKTPREMLSGKHISSMFKQWRLGETSDLSWQFVEEQDAKMMREKKDAYILHCQDFCKGINQEVVYGYGRPGAPSAWSLKKISYMQATSASVARTAVGL
ncbi:hypothetical protein VTL71DRAFT_5738 [Oculimacula yallundae]|uniref:Uncharacterized protein n=1 Tax=Oculimacula yallundae TaxID=86028 RepID=A0ABR4BYB8_9HELO